MIDSPINTHQQLMIITAEECGELTQRCSKMLRKDKTISDIEEDQRIKFVEEVGDVFCMIELMVGHGITNWREIHDRSDVKKDKLKLWSNLIHG